MKQKINLFEWLAVTIKEFMVDVAAKPQYEIVDIFECKKTGFTKAVIKLSERHTKERNISDIIMDNELIANLYLSPLKLRVLKLLNFFVWEF